MKETRNSFFEMNACKKQYILVAAKAVHGGKLLSLKCYLLVGTTKLFDEIQ